MKQVLLLIGMTILCNAYFEDDAHRANFGYILEDFTERFTSQFDVIAFGQMDWHSKLELAFNYWVTSIRLRGIHQAKLTYEVEMDGLVIRIPNLVIELWIEEKYTVPIKVENFEFSVLLSTSPTYLRCSGTQIDYDEISLDLGMVVEYLTKQVLSLDSIKQAIKQAEIPIRNFIAQAFMVQIEEYGKKNWERTRPLIKSLKHGSVDTTKWMEYVLDNVKGINAKGDEFWVQVQDLFQIPSSRKAQPTDDL